MLTIEQGNKHRTRSIVAFGCLFLATALVLVGCSDSGDEGAIEPGSLEELQLGAQLYEGKCAFCHGFDGDGNLGPSLLGVEKRLTPPTHTDIVRTGRSPDMPAFGSQLSEMEIAAVVAYERSGFVDVEALIAAEAAAEE